MLTGRQDGWERLKKTGGLSGYPSRAESEHDHVENSHASTSLSWADGLARGYALTGQQRHVVAVIGDGALTGGHGLGGAEQHRRRARTATSSSWSTTTAAPTPRPSAGSPTGWPRCGCSPATSGCWRPASRRCSRTPVVGGTALRRAARAQGRRQGRAEPAGAVLRPRAQVLRPGRRARHRGDGVGAAPGPALRRAGDRARRHPQGQRLPARRERRGRADAQPGRVRPGDRAAHRAAVGRLDQRVRRGDGGARGPPAGRRRDHRGDARPHRARAVRRGLPGALLRRRHRRAARAHLRGRARHGRAAPGRRGLLDVPQPGVRPAADGRGAAPQGRHAGARPGRGHRQRRAVAQRHVGPVAARHRARACGWPPRATPARCARSSPRPSRSTTGPPRSASRRAR